MAYTEGAFSRNDKPYKPKPQKPFIPVEVPGSQNPFFPSKPQTPSYSGNGAGAGAMSGDKYTKPKEETTGTGGNNGGVNNSTTPPAYTPQRPEVDYAGMIADALREQQEAAARKLQAQIKQGVNTLESQRPELQQQYDQAAQSAYVQNMLSKRDLPQAMAASGYTGGLHESSLVDLDNTYGNNLNALKAGYNSSVNALDRDIANLKATGNISLAENANNYAQLIAEAAREAQAAQLAAQTKYAGGGLSFSQAKDAYDSGIRTSNVLSVLKNAYGDDWEATASNMGNNSLSNTAKYYAGNINSWLPHTAEAQKEQAVLDYITKLKNAGVDFNTMQELARYYLGVNLTQ